MQRLQEYRKAFNASAAGAAQDRQKAAKALIQIETKIAGILKAIEDGMYHASMKAKMTELEAEQSRLQSVLAESPEPPALRLHPSLSVRYRELIEDLARSLNAPEVKREAAEALRGLISEVRMVPDTAARNGHTIELIGNLRVFCVWEVWMQRSPRVLRGLRRERWLRELALVTVSFQPRRRVRDLTCSKSNEVRSQPIVDLRLGRSARSAAAAKAFLKADPQFRSAAQDDAALRSGASEAQKAPFAKSRLPNPTYGVSGPHRTFKGSGLDDRSETHSGPSPCPP